MAPLPELEDVYRCAFKWSADNTVNVLHFHSPTTVPATIFSRINNHVTANMWAPVANFLAITQVDITPLFASAATQSFATDSSSKWKGTMAAGESVPAACAVVSLHTLLRGPANRGRVFVGPVAESAMSFGLLDDTKRNAMIAAWGAFGTALIADDTQHVVASYKHVTALTVINYSVRSAIGTMRPRQDRKAA